MLWAGNCSRWFWSAWGLFNVVRMKQKRWLVALTHRFRLGGRSSQAADLTIILVRADCLQEKRHVSLEDRRNSSVAARFEENKSPWSMTHEFPTSNAQPLLHGFPRARSQGIASRRQSRLSGPLGGRDP